ncbi:MAG: 5'/3'-nucleotidase SurE, partial [Pirellulaceae bacterium]
GANLGSDIWESGTVAAAREAALHGYPAVAISQYRHPTIDLDWPSSANRASQLLSQIYSRSMPGNGLWNLNLPAIAPAMSLPEMVQCVVDPSRRPLVWKREADSVLAVGDYHRRPRLSGSDVDHCFSGSPSLSWIPLHHSNEP